jgi:hypothetical protein
LNQILLDIVNSKLDHLIPRHLSVHGSQSQTPDLSPKHADHKEWTNINKWIRHNPLKHLPRQDRTALNQPLVKLKRMNLHYWTSESINAFEMILNETNLISQAPVHRPYMNEPNHAQYAACPSGEFLILEHKRGIFSITRNKDQHLPTTILDALSYGLSFVPHYTDYPIETIDNSFADFERRLRWKFFWHHQTTQKRSSNSERFLPQTLRKGCSSEPPANSVLSNYTELIKQDFKSKIRPDRDTSNPKRKLAININQTIKFFRSNQDSLVLKPADKGSGIVIMDREFYSRGVHEYINSNPNFFTLVRVDPTPALLSHINSELNSLRRSGHLDYRTSRMLSPDNASARCPYLYGLPKIHKTPVAFRPIVSGNGHPTEKLSIFIDFLLQPYVTLNDLYLKDSTDLLNSLNPIRNLDPDNTTLFSLDVVSMYPNIPLNELIDSILTTLHSYPQTMLKHKSTQYSTPLIKKLLELVLFNNYFQFEGKFYHQTHGIAMGTPCACSTSDIFICNWIKKALQSAPHTPMFYRQYRDDGFGIWQGDIKNLFDLVDWLNQQHSTIQFTLTHGKSINYLDLTVSISPYGHLTTETYYKPTDSHAYLHTLSNHPRHCLENIALSQTIRHLRNCSNYSSFLYHSQYLKHNLLQKGHDFHLISQKIDKIKFNTRKRRLNYTKPKINSRTPLIITHNHNMPNLTSIVRRISNDTLDGDNLAAIGGFPIIGYRVQRSLGSSIIRAKT